MNFANFMGKIQKKLTTLDRYFSRDEESKVIEIHKKECDLSK